MTAAENERNRVRLETLDAYGGVCICCGEAEPYFLTIEHGNKDGAQHREQLGHHGKGVGFYRWLRVRGFPKDLGLSVLCHNCNHVSYWRDCPHQTGKGLRDLDVARQRRAPEDIKHGDHAMYQRGCRCDLCYATGSKYNADQYQKRKASKAK